METNVVHKDVGCLWLLILYLTSIPNAYNMFTWSLLHNPKFPDVPYAFLLWNTHGHHS